MVKIVVALILLHVNFSCKSQVRDNTLKIIEIYDAEYGKQAFMQNELDLLSKITNINKKFLGTSIYAVYEGNRIEIPTNSKYFNYEAFGNNPETFKNKKAKLHLRRYIYKGKEYLIAIKIE